MFNSLTNDKILHWSKMKEFADDLTHSLIPVHHFETIPNSNMMQTTIEMWLLNDFKITDCK